MTRMKLKRSSITTTQPQELLTTKKESLASRVTLLTWAMSMRTMRMKTRVTTVTKMVKMVTTLRSMRLIQARNYILTANQVMLQLLSTPVLIHTTKESQVASSKSHKD